MPTYKLTYFNGRGRAELSRLCFAAAGVQYEDIRIERKDWANLKPKTMNGKLPFLEVDGRQLPEGDAIARYIARENGLAGTNSWETAQTDMILGICNDLKREMVQAFFEKDETQKAEKMKKLSSETFPTFLSLFQKILVSNNSGDGFFFGSALTIGDLAVLDVLDLPMEMGMTSLDKFPDLAAHKKRVSECPRIADWLKKRPITQF